MECNDCKACNGFPTVEEMEATMARSAARTAVLEMEVDHMTGKVVKEKYVFSKGQFWADRLDAKMVECAFAKSDLPDDWRTTVKFSVAPRDSFGNRGVKIS